MLRLSDVQADIKTGDLLLFRGRGLFAQLVMLRTRSVYSHVGIAYRMRCNGTSRLCVIEALEPGGVRLFPLDVRLADGDGVDWYELVDPAINGEHVAAFALKQWGRAYAWKQLWWSFSRCAALVRHLFRLRLTNVQAKDFFCSELAAQALLEAGYRSDEGTPVVATDPGSVSRFNCVRRRCALLPDTVAA